MNKTKRAAINSLIGIIFKLVCMIFPFIIRMVIVKIMGNEYAGLNSLFSSIISALSLAELGISNAVIYCMYKPIVEKDYNKLSQLLNFIRRVYFFIGVIILVIGILITPFLDLLIKGGYPDDINLIILFSMYLFNLSFGYFFYGYTTTLFLSHQRNDVISLISLMVFVLQYIVQFLVLIYTRNYMLYILVFAIAVIPQNFLYMKVSKRMYPNITCVGDISKELKHSIKIEVTSLLGHRIGAVILVSIDSAIISAFLGLSELGKYGNYYYIYSSIISLTSIISQSMLAGIGSKIITDKSNIYNLFNKLNFAWIYLVTVCACCLSGLLNPFITLIIGGNYTYSSKVVLVMVIYYFSWQFRNMGLLFKDASGLWSKDWYKPYIGMIVNLAFSVIFIMIFKSVISVLIPTIIVFLFIYYPIETRIIHRYLFNLSPMEFVVSNNKIIIVSILSIIINHYLCNYYIVQVNIKFFIIKFIVSIIIPTFLFAITYHSSSLFDEILNDIRYLLK